MEEFENGEIRTEEQTVATEEIPEAEVTSETETVEEKEPTFTENPTEFSDKPLYNEIELSPVEPETEKASKKGLVIFALCVAAVLTLTLATVIGYYFGEKSGSFTSGGVKVDLAEKPKDSEQLAPAKVYEKLNESVVGIRVYGKDGAAYDASGVIYSKNGYIVTNDHIYSQIQNPEFRIYMSDGKEYDAKYVAGDSVSDIAILKIKDSADTFKVPQFGNSKEIVFGESVAAIGKQNTASDKTSITVGVVSNAGCRVQTTSSYSAKVIQCDNAVGVSSSGGALVNMYGQVVGITSAQLVSNSGGLVCYAIPTVTVKRIADQLISDGKVTDRAKLGITYTEIDSVTAKLNGSSSTGLYVASVSSDSDLSGSVGEGDIITHINGIKITKDDIVLDFLEEHKAGDKIKLTVLHEKGNTKEYEITLKANIGESSYNSNITSGDNQQGSNGGTFNFPSGE